MTQTPITVTYSIEEILGQIQKTLANIQEDITELKIGQVRLENELKGEIKAIEAKLTGEIQSVDLKLSGQIQSTDLKLGGQIQSLDSKLIGEIKTLDATVGGIGKRLDTQEFINRSVVVGFVLAVGAAVTKILFPNWLT